MNNYINPPSCTLPALSGESRPGTFLMKWAERRSSYQNQNCCNRHPDDDFLVVLNLIFELGEAAAKVVCLETLRTINRSPAVLSIQIREIFLSIFLTKISSSPVISTALPFGNIKYSSNLGEKHFNRRRPFLYWVFRNGVMMMCYVLRIFVVPGCLFCTCSSLLAWPGWEGPSPADWRSVSSPQPWEPRNTSSNTQVSHSTYTQSHTSPWITFQTSLKASFFLKSGSVCLGLSWYMLRDLNSGASSLSSRSPL